ncbi:putative RNA uridine N3 methyltransferase [Methanopyrus kandleri]
MVAVAFPWSLFSEETDPKIYAYRVGTLARALAIYRVEDVYLYGDGVGTRRNAERLRKLLEYQECPQYLRKRVFRLDRDLRYAGVMPPLRAPHHKIHPPKEGEVREGYVVRRSRNGALVDVGADRLARTRWRFKPHERVTVRVVSEDPLEVEPAEPEEYWGYRVRIVNELNEVLREFNEGIIVTSRYGEDVREVEFKSPVKCLVFGSSEVSVLDVDPGVRDEYPVINFVPNQGVQVVRTEEAVHATLAVLNYLGLI